MSTLSLLSIVGVVHHGQPCRDRRISRINRSKLLERRIQSNSRWPYTYFPKPKVSACTSNSTPSEFPPINHTEAVQAYPNASPIKITQEESEKLKRICSSVEDSRVVVPESEIWDLGITVDDVKLLLNIRSKHNYSRVLEVSRRLDHPLAGARLLLLDKPGNIHSMYFKYKILTQNYYDVFGTPPPLLPHGTLGILGMGAGTAARLIFHFWPSIDIQGWELDPMVIWIGRKYFDLLQLERDHPENFGVHIGDALEANVPGGFSGLIVDLFSQGSVICDLQSARTWRCLKERLRDGGRIMVNCGGKCVEAESPLRDGDVVMHETLAALAEVFPGEVFVLRLGHHKEDSSIALTGSLPCVDGWKQALPSCLRCYVHNWVPVSDFV